tara:strand:+ start:1758 stop:2180 length:423 start_codon:yes stop_codon:yes gene_type:complete
MIVQFSRKRYQSSKALGVGLAVGIIHAGLFELIEFNVPVIFYAVMFLLSYGWFCLLDWLDLKFSTVCCGFLVAFQIVMVFNSINGDVVNSALYFLYPTVIMVINVLMIGSGLGESDDMATSVPNADCYLSSHKKNEGSIK